MISEDYIRARARHGISRVWCPSCGPNRRDKRDRSLSIRMDGNGIGWRCWHCEETGMLTEKQEKTVTATPKAAAQKEVASVVPLRTIEAQPLSDGALAYLSERGISEEIAKLCGAVSGAKFFRKLKREAPAVGFVYRAKGRDYAVKWRCIEDKDFTQDGAAQTLFLSDRIAAKDNLIITEGEIDALSFWQAGLPFAVSIPSGAIQATSDEDGARTKWLSHNEDLLTGAKNIFLAVDADGPGQTTAQELARRIGKAKCWEVRYPEGCKDANDVLIQHGADALQACIAEAKPWPVEGLATPRDYADRVRKLYQNGMPPGFGTGWSAVDEFYTLNPGNLVVVTGIPGHGKSSWLDALLVNAMSQHGWRVAYASFESPPELHLARLAALKTGKPFGQGPNPRMTEQEMEDALDWVSSRVTFLTHDGVMPTVQSLVQRFEAAVLRSGVKAHVVDPFNFVKLNTTREGGMDTEAIGEMLAEFKMLAQRTESVFFLVAHPAKPMGQPGDWVPTGYSISGSANFYNRCDFGLTMHRGPKGNALHVWKAKWAHQGKIGQVALSYDHKTGGFSEPSEASNEDDFTLDLEGFDASEPF